MDNYVQYNAAGEAVSFVGFEAVDLFRARMLASHLKLYAKTGIKPTRGVGLKQMLALASGYTRKRYPNTKAAAIAAAEDVKVWADALALSLPHVEG